MRLLLFNLATDADDPILGFTTRWICALAERVEFTHVKKVSSSRGWSAINTVADVKMAAVFGRGRHHQEELLDVL
jgi:hypothetical protein